MCRQELPEEAVVVRGGRSTPHLIEKGISMHPEGVSGISVVSGPLCSILELAATVPHRMIGCTTVREVRVAGGDVIPTSGMSPYHATLIGLRKMPVASSNCESPKEDHFMERDTDLPCIFADFNNADKQGRVRLNTVGTKSDLDRLGISLSDGMRILIDDEDEITANGIVRFCPYEGWVAEVDWDELKGTGVRSKSDNGS